VQAEAAIREIVDRETRAWNTGDVELLLSVFHPDMVWAWPATYTSVDPVDWHLVMGRFDAARWGALYAELFRSRTLVHNRRETVRVEFSAEEDG
jgi:ketosteroid isomerase-like protein